MTKPKATPQQIEKYHKLLIYFAEQRRGRPPPKKCEKVDCDY